MGFPKGIRRLLSPDLSIAVVHPTGPITEVETGGGANSFEAVRSLAPVTAHAGGTSGFPSWDGLGPASFLDYSDPVRPAIKLNGMYTVTVFVQRHDAIFNDPGQMAADLQLDVGGTISRVVGLAVNNTLSVANPALAIAVPSVSLSITRGLSVGMKLLLRISNGGAVDREYEFLGVVAKH